MCFFNFLGTILFIILLVWAFKTFVRGGRYYRRGGRRGPWNWHEGHRASANEHGDALGTARERFARGDITAEQFETIKQGLTADEGHGATASDWLPWNRDEALETARLRFARSEISAEEFATLKKVLQG